MLGLDLESQIFTFSFNYHNYCTCTQNVCMCQDMAWHGRLLMPKAYLIYPGTLQLAVNTIELQNLHNQP